MASTATKTVKRIARTPGVLPALVTALGVTGFVVAQDAVSIAVGWMGIDTRGLYDLDPFSGFLAQTVVPVVAFGLGYFLALWAVAPISERLGLGHVITRSVLAVGMGATLWFVVTAVVAVASSVLLGGASIPELLGGALRGALVALVALAPVGVLGGVLLWRWRVAHPATYAVEGLIDV